MQTSEWDHAGRLNINRRHFFGRASGGVGLAALATLLQSEHAPTATAAGIAHAAPRAKRVIYLFQSGGPPQLDLYDYKPFLDGVHRQEVPDSIFNGQRLTGMTAGNSTVWRLSFEAEPAPTAVSHPTGVTVPGLQFDLGAPRGLADCELRFPGAQVANVNHSPASQGMWLVQPTAVGAAEGKLCRVVCGGVSRGWPLQGQRG